MRMVPDIAAHADPETGYRIFVGGQPRVIGGTSSATALYAGLFAAFGPKRGFITPDLYKNQVCFNDIRGGDNGMFRAMVGPDPCTGIGSPRANLLAKRIGSDAATLGRVRRQLSTKNARFQAGIDNLQFGQAMLQVASHATEAILRPRFLTQTGSPDARAIVYSLLPNIPPDADPLATDARSLKDFGYLSFLNFQNLAGRIDDTIQRIPRIIYSTNRSE